MLKLILKVNNIINLNNDTETTAPVINNLTENWLLDLSNQFTYVTSWTESLLLFLLLFFIGLSGIVFNYRNYLVTMLCIEIMYLGITVCFLIVSVATSDPKGQIYALILLIAAAAESAIGLGVLVVLYKFGKSIDFADYQELRG